jgi:hypothetical protein
MRCSVEGNRTARRVQAGMWAQAGVQAGVCVCAREGCGICATVCGKFAAGCPGGVGGLI